MKKLLIILSMAICLTAVSEAKDFTDLQKEHWAYEYVSELSSKGIIKGYEDNTFKPDKKLTRAEFATIFVNYFNKNNQEAISKKDYKDVKNDDWFYKYVQIAQNDMLVWGDFFYPNDIMKREDVAYAIVKVCNLEKLSVNTGVLSNFTDSNEITDFLKNYVALAVEHGYMSGKGTEFDPQAGLTRAEVCALLGKDNKEQGNKKSTTSENKEKEIIEDKYSTEVKELIKLGILDTNINLEKEVTRSEASKLICKLAGFLQEDADNYKNKETNCTDVSKGSEYAGWINLAINNNYLIAYPDNTYKPNEKISTVQLITLVINILERGEYVSSQGTWPENYISEAARLGILDGLSENANSKLTYNDLSMIFYNCLDIKVGMINEGGSWNEKNETLREKYFNNKKKEVNKQDSQLAEWKYGGYESIEPYKEYECEYIDGKATGNTRYTGTFYKNDYDTKIKNTNFFVLTEKDMLEAIEEGKKGFEYVSDIINNKYSLKYSHTNSSLGEYIRKYVEQVNISTPYLAIMQSSALKSTKYETFTLKSAQDLCRTFDNEYLNININYVQDNFEKPNIYAVVIKQGDEFFSATEILGKDDYPTRSGSEYTNFIQVYFDNSKYENKKIDFTNGAELIIAILPENEIVYNIDFSNFR